MRIEIRPCPVAEILTAPNIAELLDEYGAESGIDAIGKPTMQPDLYRELEALGVIRTIGAFDGDALVGFLALVVSVLPHYGVRTATTESYFVAQSARKTGAGLALLHEAERVARDAGAAALLVSAPFGGRLAEVLPAVGYQETNRVFCRGLQ